MKDIIYIEQKLKTLANKKRLEIIRLLKQKKELTVIGISDGIHLSFRSTSKHLTQLYRANIIRRHQRSKFVYYTLSLKNPSFVTSILRIL